MKKFIFSFLRFSISFIIIYFLLRKIDVRELSLRITNLSYSFLFLAFICQLSVAFIGAYRWQTLLQGRGIKVSFGKLLEFGFIGQFFNSFLPGSSGGDFVKMYKVVTHSKDKVYAGISVLAEKVIGFYSISIFVIIAGVFSFGLLPERLLWTIFLIIIFAFLGLFVFIYFKTCIIKFLGASGNQENILAKIKQYVVTFYEALHFFITHREILLKIIVISLLMQFLSIISCYFIARSVGLCINVFYFFIFIPIVFLITVIPISLSGIGVREGVFVYLFGKVNVPSDQAVLISFLFFTLIIVFSLIGGVVHFWSNVKSYFNKRLT
ncbi:MAG: lysylphosphatidylglycerol synthase transmembrane domain-containing protein [bacterium]